MNILLIPTDEKSIDEIIFLSIKFLQNHVNEISIFGSRKETLPLSFALYGVFAANYRTVLNLKWFISILHMKERVVEYTWLISALVEWRRHIVDDWLTVVSHMWHALHTLHWRLSHRKLLHWWVLWWYV